MSNSDSGQDIGGWVPQHTLGTINSMHTQQDRSWNHGYLALGKVLNVYPKRYTADVEIFKSADQLHSSHEQEGRHACKIGVSTAGFSDLYQTPYGEIVPIQRGNIVLVGFLKNTKEQPVILRVFHDTSEEVGSFNFRNILSNYFSAYSNIGDILDYLKITPIQDFLKIDRFGNVELASHTKSFFVATESNLIDDQFDYEDLSPKFPKDKTVINPLPGISDLYDSFLSGQSYYNGDDAKQQLSSETIHVDKKYSNPKKYMAVFRDNYTDSATNWLRLIIDAAHTSFRILKIQQQRNQNTDFNITEDGTVKIRRQLDTRKLFDPDTPQTELNPKQNPCKVYSEIQMMPDGTIRLETVDRTNVDPNDPTMVHGFSSQSSVGADESKDFPHTRITINPLGGNVIIETNSILSAYAKSGINMYSKNDININSEKTINITSLAGTNVTSQSDINVNSQTTTYVGAVENVDVSAPDVGVSGAIDMRGSMDMKGKIELIGATNVMGKTRVNSRGPILDGDHDAHGYRNYKSLVDRVKNMAIGFGMSYLSKQLAAPLSNMSSVLGMFHVATNGFELNDINVVGVATRYASSTFGKLIKNSSPFMPALKNFCIKQIFAPASMAGQIDFMDQYLELDLGDMGNLSKLGNLAKAAGFDLRRLKGIGDVAEQLGIKLNFLTDMKQLANQYNADLNDLNIVSIGADMLELDFNEVMTIVTQILESGLNVNDVGDLGIAAAAEGEELNGLKDIMKGGVQGVTNAINILWSRFTQANDIHEDWGSAVSTHEFNLNDEQTSSLLTALGALDLKLNPNSFDTDIVGEDEGLEGLRDSVDLTNIKREGQKITHNNSNPGGGGSTDTTIEYVTIEDALQGLSKYFVGGLTARIAAVEQYFDSYTGWDTSQWNSTNRKSTTTTGGSGSGEGGNTTTTIRPAAVNTIEQYTDRCIKRYVFIECEKMIKQFNAAWKYYVYNE